jgi:Spy/CpxP family protein refolding chaperone
LAAAVTLTAAALNAVSSGLAALTAYASGSDDEGENHAAPAINVEAAALIAEQQRVQELRTKWTQEVLKQQKGKIFVPITLTDTLIKCLEDLCKAKKRKAKGVRTSWSVEDKQVVIR